MAKSTIWLCTSNVNTGNVRCLAFFFSFTPNMVGERLTFGFQFQCQCLAVFVALLMLKWGECVQSIHGHLKVQVILLLLFFLRLAVGLYIKYCNIIVVVGFLRLAVYT